MARVFWFRRDLRLADNIALNEAVTAASKDADAVNGVGSLVALYAFDMQHFNSLLPIRQHSIVESLNSLGASIDRKLTIQQGADQSEMVQLIVKVAQAANANTVHATRAFDPAAIAEQNAVGLALKDVGIFLQLTDSYYAVAPGSVKKPDGTAYKVYTPFYKAWNQIAWNKPVKFNGKINIIEPVACHGRPTPSAPAPFAIKAGEAFALRTLDRFRKRALANYDELRNRADLSGTSHLSHALAFGEIHPRTILSKLGDSPAETVFAKEIAWREFYADVLWHNPKTTTEYYSERFAEMRYDSGKLADSRLLAWQRGETGFPMVDAGMRQLLAEGWMHNRVRMIVASFLVKDLHLEWQQGADWFEKNLSDFDPASNAHGWQWTAGCGTDASPYYRIFNPILQGYKFDPNGDYVRKYIPELRHIEGEAVHEPWRLLDGYSNGYPVAIVDHAIERDEALARLKEIKID